MEKETLEEAAKKFADDCTLVSDAAAYKGFIDGAKWQQEQQLNTSTVTRVEVIQHSEPFNGRAYTNYRAKDVEIQFQDNNETLKIFLK
jgi:hypothetical protein